MRLPLECAWRPPVVELLGGVDRVGLDELRAAISSLERNGRRAGATSASDKTVARWTATSSGQLIVERNGIDAHRSKSNVVVPPAPPPSPLVANSRSQSISVAVNGVNGRVAERRFVRSLFCCCCCCCGGGGCEREQSPKMADSTKTMICKQISVIDDNRGISIRPSQLALISEQRSKNVAVDGAGLSECVESLASSNVHVELESSGGPAIGVQESARRQFAVETEECEVKRIECTSHVMSATDYVRRRRAELYASLVSTAVSTTTDDQESTREDGYSGHVNGTCPTLPPTVDQPRRTKLVMYFEQHRGVLVLDVDHFRCDGDENGDSGGVVVACICTRRDQVERMRRDLISGRLADDLAEALGHDDNNDETAGRSAGNGRILSEPEVSFDVAIDVSELDVAHAELA